MVKRFKRMRTQRMGSSLLTNILLGLLLLFAAYAVVVHRFLMSISERPALLDRVLYQFLAESLQFSPGQVGLQYLPVRPRTVGYYFETPDTGSFIGSENLDPNVMRLYNTHRVIGMTTEELERQEELLDSRDYNLGKAEKFEDGDCVAQYDWQLKSSPTCNFLLEQDMTQLLENPESSAPYGRYLSYGYWRDVWMIADESASKMVLKTMRYEHDYEARNYDRHRRDAVAMERLTSSPWIVDIYGMCGNSGLFEFADGGSLYDKTHEPRDDDDEDVDHRKWNSTGRMIVAYQVASGLADLHNFDMEGRASVAHADITTSQYVYSEQQGMFKLNDFNRCRFIRWNKKTNEACSYRVGNNPGTFRSPEEYAYGPQSEKVDVYSMGNILYSLIAGKSPFRGVRAKEVPAMVKAGRRTKFELDILHSTDPLDKAMLRCIQMCWVQDPEKRASARQVQTYIGKQLSDLGIHPSQSGVV